MSSPTASRVLASRLASLPLDVRRRTLRKLGASPPARRLLRAADSRLPHRGRPVELPVIVFVAVGHESELLEASALALGEAGRNGGFRPLLVIDVAEFASLRRKQILFDYVMPRRMWNDLNPWAEYEDYAHSRFGEIADSWQAVAVIPLPSRGVQDIDVTALRTLTLNVR